MATPARPLPAGTARPETQGRSPPPLQPDLQPDPQATAPAGTLQAVPAAEVVTDLACTVVERLAVTHDVRVLRLRTPEGQGLRYRAGQYARLDVPGVGHRYFSLGAPPPADGSPARLLEFHVRAAPGSETGRILHDGVRPGDRLTVHGPLGRACWTPGDPRPLLLVGGGTGFAPVLAIAEAAMTAGLAAPVRVYLGVRDEPDVYHEDRLRALALAHPGFRYEVALSEPQASRSGRRHGNIGDLLAQDLVREGALPPGCQVYVAGPPAMVQATRAVLERLGVNRADVHGDG